MSSYFQNGITAGSNPSRGASTDFGVAVLMKSVEVTTLADGSAVSGTITLPANSSIVDYKVDRVVAPSVGGGTATTLPVTVGTAAASTQYMNSVDLFSTARAAPTLSAAQVLALSNIGSNTNVVVTVDPNGTILTTQARVRLTVQYVPSV